MAYTRDTATEDELVDGTPAGESREWNWHPAIPVPVSPMFTWPIGPLKAVFWYLRAWLPVSEHLFYVALALLVWGWLQPPLAETTSLEPGWVFGVWARNLILFAAMAGFLHCWFYVWRMQGDTYKFDRREPLGTGGRFLFGSQVKDNATWGLASGVTVWTAYETGLWLAYANDVAPLLAWDDNPVLFVILFPAVTLFSSVHFFAAHRLLHWMPLYRLAHAVHHRNSTTGPWSGFSMHPVEHVIYVSSLLIHLVVPSHPLHMLFHGYWVALATTTSHCGFEAMKVGPVKIPMGTFFHQLHHRYFECNYGNLESPFLDRLIGSFHDGTAAATRKMRQIQLKKHKSAPAT